MGARLTGRNSRRFGVTLIDPWFDLQAGVRFDAAPKDRVRLALGVQGLAPYWIETEATAFVSNKGDVTARLDLEHDMRITRKLILQPRAELNFSCRTSRTSVSALGCPPPNSAASSLRIRAQLRALCRGRLFAGVWGHQAFREGGRRGSWPRPSSWPVSGRGSSPRRENQMRPCWLIAASVIIAIAAFRTLEGQVASKCGDSACDRSSSSRPGRRCVPRRISARRRGKSC